MERDFVLLPVAPPGLPTQSLTLQLHGCHRPHRHPGVPDLLQAARLVLRPVAKPAARPQAKADLKPKRKRGGKRWNRPWRQALEPAAEKEPPQLAAVACRGFAPACAQSLLYLPCLSVPGPCCLLAHLFAAASVSPLPSRGCFKRAFPARLAAASRARLLLQGPFANFACFAHLFKWQVLPLPSTGLRRATEAPHAGAFCASALLLRLPCDQHL